MDFKELRIYESPKQTQKTNLIKKKHEMRTQVCRKLFETQLDEPSTKPPKKHLRRNNQAFHEAFNETFNGT